MSTKPAILLVEDNLLVKKISVVILENLNCVVDTAVTGGQAIELANQNKYDIILVDIGLPDMDGFDVIAYIRNDSKLNQNSTIIALTAHLDREYMKQSLEVGASDFLAKPINYAVGKSMLHKFPSIDFK